MPRSVTAPTSTDPRPYNRTAELGESFVLEFDARSDGGARLVGPFDTRGQADAYVRDLHLDEAVYCVCPMTTP